MKLGLDQNVVFVTGASAGLGRAPTLTFAEEGARVAIGYHTNESAARAVADTAVEHGATGALPVQLDLADPPTLGHAVDVIRATLGPLHVLVNCAVWWPEWQPEGERFEEAPTDRFVNSVQANLVGPYLLARLAVGDMRTRDGGGSSTCRPGSSRRASQPTSPTPPARPAQFHVPGAGPPRHPPQRGEGRIPPR